jgi:hypothetical protein
MFSKVKWTRPESTKQIDLNILLGTLRELVNVLDLAQAEK